jgi:hypothetical protein
MIFDCSYRDAAVVVRVWQLRARQNQLRSIKSNAITGLEAAQMNRDPENGTRRGPKLQMIYIFAIFADSEAAEIG